MTLTRSEEQTQDVQKLHQIYSLLAGNQGEDRFVIHLAGGANGAVELAFPNDTTRYCPELEHKLTAIVGDRAVRIE